MRKIREILRLHAAGLGARVIARSCSISHSTVLDMMRRAKEAGLGWPLSEDIDDSEIERRLYPHDAGRPKAHAEPDWNEIHKELKRKGVTLQLLWREYREKHPDDGYQYTQFSVLYRKWSQKLDVVLRQEHRAGEKLFVDFAGPTIPIVDPETGEVCKAHVFGAVLGASNYMYALAVWAEDLAGWIQGHVRAFDFFGGVPEIVVPDNPKALVSKASRYEPDLNPTYQEMAMHYGVAIIPARARKPKDKAKVEKGIQVIEQWILAPLRNRTFFSLAALNEAIAQQLEWANQKPFQKLPGSRRSFFETLDKPALRPLPAARYEFAEWKQARVNIDYHIDVAGTLYSVPYQLVGEQVDVRITPTTVEAFHKGRRVASHRRNARQGATVMEMARRPASHRAHLEWTPSRIIAWAERTGPKTAQLVKDIMVSWPHPEQGYRSCLGILRLGRSYAAGRMEAAAARALATGAVSYKSVKSILENGLDQVPLESGNPDVSPVQHDNVRGRDYYGEGANA